MVSVLELDMIAGEYAKWCWDQGHPKSDVTKLSAALSWGEPSLTGTLKGLHRYAAAMERLIPPESFLPLPWELCRAVIGFLCWQGRREAAIATWLSFDTGMRISEIVGCRVRAFFPPTHPYLPPGRTEYRILINQSKGGRWQDVLVRNPRLQSLLLELYTVGDRNAFLFPSFRGRSEPLRSLLKAALLECGVPEHSYVFHSLRHGMAGFAYLHGIPIETIRRRLRHQSDDTTEVYLKGMRAQLLSDFLPRGDSVKVAFWNRAHICLDFGIIGCTCDAPRP